MRHILVNVLRTLKEIADETKIPSLHVAQSHILQTFSGLGIIYNGFELRIIVTFICKIGELEEFFAAPKNHA